MPDRPDLARLFDRGPPHGWTPSVGQRVAVYWGSTPAGAAVSVETVVRVGYWTHPSGNTYPVFTFEGGRMCGRNSVRPLWRRGRKTT